MIVGHARWQRRRCAPSQGNNVEMYELLYVQDKNTNNTATTLRKQQQKIYVHTYMTIDTACKIEREENFNIDNNKNTR